MIITAIIFLLAQGESLQVFTGGESIPRASALVIAWALVVAAAAALVYALVMLRKRLPARGGLIFGLCCALVGGAHLLVHYGLLVSDAACVVPCF